jgi:DNA-binding HxlR family transcriptional regulator
MKRKSLQANLCAIARSLDLIGDWWSLLIVRDAAAGIGRFSEFQRSLEIPKNILSTRLKSLVERGILQIVPASDGSAYQEYALTDKGQALLPVLVALGQWGAEHLFESTEQSSVPVDLKDRQPLQKLEIKSVDGRVLNAKDVLVPRILFPSTSAS